VEEQMDEIGKQAVFFKEAVQEQIRIRKEGLANKLDVCWI